jgi:hypothetical protein
MSIKNRSARIRLAIGRWLEKEGKKMGEMTAEEILAEREAKVSARELECDKRDADLANREAELDARIASESIVREANGSKKSEAISEVVSEPHEHTFIAGVAPGSVRLRICTFPGCGFTEKV